MQLNKSALTVVYSNYQCNQNTKYGVLDNIVYEFGTGASVRYASKGITRQNIYKKYTQAQHQIIGNYSWSADSATGDLILTPYYNDNITEYDEETSDDADDGDSLRSERECSGIPEQTEG
jgi:hypothetical protein